MKQKKNRRAIDVVVISDVHLGTYGCHAKELLRYLKSIRPRTIILNGDFIDIWQFSKHYWPKSHMKVVKYLMNQVSKGVKLHYITGNHDELLRKFKGFRMGSFSIENKLLLPLQDGQQAWIFHGDVFDVTMQHSRWLCKLGAVGYDTLILLNRLVNWFSVKVLGKGKISLSKKIKNSVKKAISYVADFEQTAAEIGIENGFDYVICGHIHQPQMREVSNGKGTIMYLNSGDWIESLTALEYAGGAWSLYQYDPALFADDDNKADDDPDTSALFLDLLNELNLMRTL